MMSIQTHPPVKVPFCSLAVMLLFAASFLPASPAVAQPEIPTAKAEGPADHTIVGAKLGGSFFAPKALKEKYDELLGKVRLLNAEIAEGRITGEQATRDISQLRTELEAVRKAIEEQKKFVPVARIHTKSDSMTFKLGSERRLLILADKVRIVGWDQPEVKCVFDKTVLATGNQNVGIDLEVMRVVHRHRRADDEIGELQEEQDGQKARFTDWQRIYRPLQGRTIDVISIFGLSHEEGNRQIILDVTSPNGGGSMSSHWQRHAAITVYVPKCEAIAVKGGLGGLDIESVDSPAVIIRGDGDRDYHGQFQVKGLKGSLTADAIPLQTIEDIEGNVDVTMTAYLGNSGERHADNTRTSYVFVPEPYKYKSIDGNFRGRFVRADLELAEVSGQIDLENEYGHTKLLLDKPLAEKAHRVISNGGQIDVHWRQGGLRPLPLLAVSECGTVRLGFKDTNRSFESVSWTGRIGSTGVVRGWRGFERKAKSESDDSFFDRFERISQILDGKDRSPGLDLVSRGGTIQIMRSK